MPCIVEPSDITKEEWLEYMLCQACRFLTKEQIMKVQGIDIWQDLYNWYQGHLMTDAYHYSKKQAAPHNSVEFHQSMYFVEEFCEKQLQRCFSEAKKLGLQLTIEEHSVSIKPTKEVE